ncbi:ArgE/DapE family deacylase [Marmoricola endophyticus]|uniref:ArgE/DapE family deacylase n=1 Tax=Marmoricola endophyticus TaxID=2040280 RepID=UPI00166604BE|nr:ArgE/DapE family deacylase [Marmoricola endophyticus]
MTEAQLSALERRVLDHLDEDRLVAQLAALVRIPSISGSPEEVEVVEHASDLLSDAGMVVDQWEIDIDELAEDPWFPGVEVPRDRALGLAAVDRVTEDRPALVLQGHLDVVPPGDPRPWGLTDPFSAELHEGRLYGRGTCDMKAGFAANLAVLDTLRSAGVTLAEPLAVHAVVGEEDGGLGAFATMRRGHRGQAAVITEPTGDRLVVANAGALTFRIEVPGRSAHGSLRREGYSALDAFLPIHQALATLEADRNREVDPLFGDRDLPYSLSIGMLHTGDWSSSVPDRLVAEGRYGVMLGEEPWAARIAFEDAVTEASLKDPWLREHRPVVTWPGGQFASGRLDLKHPLIGEVSAAAVDSGAAEPGVRAEVYGSDLRIYSGMGGIPTLHYGPGDPTWAHAPLEHVHVDEVVSVARALTVLALRRCGVAE